MAKRIMHMEIAKSIQRITKIKKDFSIVHFSYFTFLKYMQYQHLAVISEETSAQILKSVT